MSLPYYILQVTSRTTKFMSQGSHQFQSYAEAAKAARATSKAKWVLLVTMTRIHEETEGVWRNGRKS
jgi:hypothetical protein